MYLEFWFFRWLGLMARRSSLDWQFLTNLRPSRATLQCWSSNSEPFPSRALKRLPKWVSFSINYWHNFISVKVKESSSGGIEFHKYASDIDFKWPQAQCLVFLKGQENWERRKEREGHREMDQRHFWPAQIQTASHRPLLEDHAWYWHPHAGWITKIT